MNYKDIESLKAAVMNLSQKGGTIQIPAYGVSGRVMSVGFKPYWTTPSDSKIEKLELNLLDKNNRVIPFRFSNIIGYSKITDNDKRMDNAQNISLDIYVFSPDKSRDAEPYDKVRVNFNLENTK